MKPIKHRILSIVKAQRVIAHPASIWVLLCLWTVLAPTGIGAQEYQAYRGLVGMRSNFSSGNQSIEDIATKAEELGFGAVLIADHHRLSLAWGLPPFRNLFRKKQEFPSVQTSGLRSYLRTVLAADDKFGRIIVLPGLTITPFYYWEGSPFRGDLTAHQWHTRLMVFGMNNRPEDFNNLPEINGSFSMLYFPKLVFGTAPFVLAALIGLVLFFGYRRWRVVGFLVFLIGALFATNYHPFVTTPFDAYHGDQGASPYQYLINYVSQRGGITLWNGEEDSREEVVGVARLVSRPRPDLLDASLGYSGFDAFLGGDPSPTVPGGLWDKLLLDFVAGKRPKPAWIFGSVGDRDGNSDGGNGLSTNVQTVFYLKERSQAGVMEALRRGRMYVVRKQGELRLQLDRFSVSPQGLSTESLPGQQLESPGPVQITLHVSAGNEASRPVTVNIIRDGKIVKTLQGNTPLNTSFLDEFTTPGKTSYYRIDASEPAGGRLLTNPVFVKFSAASDAGTDP
jgi:hypothetical protein